VRPDEGGGQVGLFLARLYPLVQRGDEATAMRLVYAHFHALRKAKDVGQCDQILARADTDALTPVLLVAILTAAAPVKAHLMHWSAFYGRVRGAIAKIHGAERADRILVGLE
jgi:hypothetical protein